MEAIYFYMVKIALLALGEYQTITEKGRKRTNREGKKARRKERNRGRKEGRREMLWSVTGWKRVSRHEAE